MSSFHQILYILLVVWAITDCLRRRENGFWILVIVIIPFLGPLLYFAWTRNWLGRAVQRTAIPRGAAAEGGYFDPVAEGSPAALQRKGAELVRRGRFSEAIKTLEKLLEREGPAAPPDVRYNIAIAYKEVGRYRDARDQLRLIVMENPKFFRGAAMLELADCLEQLKDDEAARKVYEQLLQMIRLPEGRYRYGMLLDRTGHTHRAVEEMQRLIRDFEESPEHHRKENRHFFNLAKEFLKRHAADLPALPVGQ
ncbi:MAG: tetratricopeptide repeat protein [Candidatus Sumerlaeia bacterium]|nr:tetratricopeptide repeat protein [Candidatus Sumerlaeia bacterium]